MIEKKRCFVCDVLVDDGDAEVILPPADVALHGEGGIVLCKTCEVSATEIFRTLGLGDMADLPQS